MGHSSHQSTAAGRSLQKRGTFTSPPAGLDGEDDGGVCGGGGRLPVSGARLLHKGRQNAPGKSGDT